VVDVVSGGNDLVVKVWDTSSGSLLRDFVRHREPVTAIAWSYPPTPPLPHSPSFARSLAPLFCRSDEVLR
jgi:WD40 repeat protein